MNTRYYQTAISKPLTYGALWSETAVSASNAVDDAIQEALYILAGKHMKPMQIVSVTHTPLTLNNGMKESVCLVVTVIAEEVLP
jgi:hypothetical protein